MKTFSTAAQTALAAGAVMTAGAVRIAISPLFAVWGGDGALTLSGESYTGVGHHGLITVTGSRLGGAEDGIELRLSGVDPDLAGLVAATDVRGAPVWIWRLLFDLSGTSLLDATIFEMGRLDRLTTEETPGGTATIVAAVETAARGLGRRTGRMTADADQRMVLSTDGALSRVTQAGELTLAWGGKPPARVTQTLPGLGGLLGGGLVGGVGGLTGLNFTGFL